MSTEYNQQLGAALGIQVEWGRRVTKPPHVGVHLSPYPLYYASVEKLWNTALDQRLYGGAARFHFAITTYLAVLGVGEQPAWHGEALEPEQRCRDAIELREETHGAHNPAPAGLLGLVVGLVGARARLDYLTAGEEYLHDPAIKETWLDSLACSVQAEVLYTVLYTEGQSLPHGQAGTSTPQLLGV